MKDTAAVALLKEMRAVHVRKGKHNVWRLPNSRIVVLSSTASDVRAVQNQIRDIKREMRRG